MRSAPAIALAALLLAAQSLGGQVPALGLGATRMGLEDRAQRLEEVALSPNQPSAAKTAAAQEAAVIRRRLAEGDFKVGDRILLLVEGEPSLSDRSEEHTSELQSRLHLVCRLLLEKKKK